MNALCLNRLKDFKIYAKKSKIVTTVRKTRGDDIDAACGQLAGEFIDRTRRSKTIKMKVS